jgi:hypothetical protein
VLTVNVGGVWASTFTFTNKFFGTQNDISNFMLKFDTDLNADGVKILIAEII